jgi:signal transduction histidine kinase
MSAFSSARKSIKEFAFKYPAVLSGYIMYSYLFISIMRFFVKAKARQLTAYEIYETFEALPFLWVLSSALVKIIDIKTRLHIVEKERLLDRQQLEIERTQLKTMHEVAKGFQHRVNNPLAVIMLALSGAKRSSVNNPKALEHLIVIEESTGRIKQSVIDFSAAQKYEVEHVGSVIGFMANPASPKLSNKNGLPSLSFDVDAGKGNAEVVMC